MKRLREAAAAYATELAMAAGAVLVCVGVGPVSYTHLTLPTKA